MRKLLNRRAEGMIFPCILIVILSMITATVIFFVSTVSMIKIQKENAKTVLDSYITADSIEIFNSIKQGSDYTEVLDSDKYAEKLKTYCDLQKRGGMLYCIENRQKTKYYISKPYIYFDKNNSLKIYVEYNLYVPIYFGGLRVKTAVIPIEIRAHLTEKF